MQLYLNDTYNIEDYFRKMVGDENGTWVEVIVLILKISIQVKEVT